MKVATWLAPALLSVLSGGGCATAPSVSRPATARVLSVSKSNAAVPDYRQGRPWLELEKRNRVALWLLTPEYDGNWRGLVPPAFLGVVKSESRTPVEFSIGDIAVTSGDRSVRLISYPTYRAMIMGNGQALLKVAEWAAGRAGEPPAGLAVMGDEEDETRIDEANKALAKAMNEAIVDRWKHMLDDARLMLDRQAYTLKSGEIVSGVVRLWPDDVAVGQPLQFTVAVDGELYRFLFDAGR